MADSELDSLLNDFLEESYDNLSSVERLLEGFLNSPDKQADINGIFRSIHTIKGGSSMFSYSNTQKMAHELESYLGQLKNNPAQIDQDIINDIGRKVSLIENALRHQDQVEASMATPMKSQEAPPQLNSLPTNSKYFLEFYDTFSTIIDEYNAKNFSQFEIVIPLKLKEKFTQQMSTAKIEFLSENEISKEQVALLFVVAPENINSNKALDELSKNNSFSWIKKFSNLSPAPVSKEEIISTSTSVTAVSQVKPKSETKESDVLRVPLDRVNGALDYIWEIFSIRNQMSYLFEEHRNFLSGNNEFLQNWEKLDNGLRRNIAELESRTMKMRMSSIRPLFKRMEKVISTYAQSSSKKINFLTKGDETELDKKVIDMLGDPLVHLIRNAMDHGIEDTETRKKSGKESEGTITLSAELRSNEVFITIQDDGKGMDGNKIIAKAKEKGIDVSHVKSPQEGIELIFLPGFSTAEKVSDVSGRGVGMDAVKTSIEQLGGKVSIQTEIGKGSSFIISLPLSMSVISCLVLGIGTDLYGIDTQSIVETHKISEFSLKTSLNKKYYQDNNLLIPCLDLREVFEHQSLYLKKGKCTEISISIIQNKDERWAIISDQVVENAQLVLKPVPELCPDISFITGVSVLPTGRPLFIISPNNLIEEHKVKEVRGVNRGAA